MSQRSVKKITIINIIFSLIAQMATLISGLIIPRLIIGYFGSNLNGLISSLNQFLGFITLVEGGIVGVVSASLYKPLAENDMDKVSSIYTASNKFFKKISLIYIVLVLLVASFYPLIFSTGYTWEYVFALTLIVGINTFIQYCFSLAPRVVINADRKGFIVSIVSVIITVGNLIITLLVVNFFKNIFLLKIGSAILFLLQPLIFGAYLNRNYKINKKALPDQNSLNQRWDGFSQTLAFFVHSNTDVVLITILSTLLNVSVYNVYLMFVSAIKMIIMALSQAINPSMGRVLAQGNEKKMNDAFNLYSFSISAISIFAFTCGAILIAPLVNVYTHGITDANYNQPLIGIFLMFAEAVYCTRDPFVSVAYAKGRFRQTAIFAYMEAFLNIVLSVVLFFIMGIAGIALATFIAMACRAILHVIYLKKHILHRSILKAVMGVLSGLFVFVVSGIICYFINFEVVSFISWFIYAFMVAGITGVILLFSTLIFNRRMLIKAVRFFFKFNKKQNAKEV